MKSFKKGFKNKFGDTHSGGDFFSGSEPKWISIGLIMGIVFGSATDNIGLGIALGICIGVAMDSTNKKKDKDAKKGKGNSKIRPQ